MADLSTHQGFCQSRTWSTATDAVLSLPSVLAGDQGYVTGFSTLEQNDTVEFQYLDGLTLRYLFKYTAAAANEFVQFPHPLPVYIFDRGTGIKEELVVTVTQVGGTGVTSIHWITKK